MILLPNDPAPDMELFLNDPKYEGLLYYLAGNPINTIDLDRG